MTSETLQEVVRAQPLQSFVLHLADGREILVDHPEVIAFRPGGRMAVEMLGDSFEFMDLLSVISLEVPPRRRESRRRRGSA